MHFPPLVTRRARNSDTQRAPLTLGSTGHLGWKEPGLPGDMAGSGFVAKKEDEPERAFYTGSPGRAQRTAEGFKRMRGPVEGRGADTVRTI